MIGKVHYWGALDRPGLCQRSKTEDGRHDWLWLPDDRLVCRYCAAEADALTGHVTKDGR